MNPEYYTYEMIDSYLRKELKGKELEDFNEKLSSDLDFYALVEAQKISNELIIDEQLLVLKDRIHSDLSKANNNGWKKWMAGLLLIAVCATTGTLIYQRDSTGENTNLSKYEIPKAEDPNKETKTNISNPVMEITSAQTKGDTIIKKKNTSSKNIQKIQSPDTLFISKDKVKTAAPISEDKKVTVPVDTEKFVPAPFKRITYAKDYKSLCEGVVITCTPKVTPSCEYEAKGSITIDQSDIKGGIAPYYFSFEGERYSTDNTFDYLSMGEYKIKIKDQKGCISEIPPIAVTEKKCEGIIDDVFAPTRNETWKFPINNSTNGEIRIYNKRGMLVYSTAITNGYPAEWDGRSNNGNELETGYYLFILQLNNGEQKQGHVTITR